ncbi:MAG: FkbM family methyltransferase [Verrucomicrobiaceae bacterium]|nr:FkbM family methyltransferase [Verrucomicrobiaceae bacterium]
MLKRLIQFVLEITGYRVVPKDRYKQLLALEHYQPSEDALAEHLRRVISFYQVDCVFDVGANNGWFRNWVRDKVGFDGLIVSFEPIAAQVRTLEKLAANDPLWIIRSCALGRREEVRDFHIMESDVFSSFLKPDPNQPSKYTDSNVLRDSTPVQVSTVEVEWRKISAQHKVKRMHLKMDTQGFDLEVFAGAEPVLESVITVQSELAFIHLYENGADYRDAIHTYSAAGYRTSMLQPISYDESLCMVEADGLFVREAQPPVPSEQV